MQNTNEYTFINAQMPVSLREKAEKISEELALDNLSALIRYLIAQEWKRRGNNGDEHAATE